MSDDRSNDTSHGDFDDWLEDDLDPPTNPYKALAADDSSEDVDDWIDFSSGATSDDERSTTSDPQHTADNESALSEDVTGEVEAVVGAGVVEETSELSEDVTGEVDPVVPVDTATVDAPEDISGEHDDTGELEVVATEDESSEVVDNGERVERMSDESTDELASVDDHDLASVWREPEGSDSVSASSGTATTPFDMTQEDYLNTATQEHAGLAESMARADAEDTVQVALAATIPGLDSTVVGFEDVVEAEGHRRVRARRSGDLIARVLTGIALVVALGASLLWRPALVAFTLTVFVLAAGEFYTALVRSGRKPIALFGFVGIVAACLGALLVGALWIPMAFIVATTALLLFYAVVPNRADPIGNLALTITVMVWVGLGSFTMLIANSESYRVLVLGVVVTVAAMDIAQYFFGRALGKHQLASWVSPKKTVEGLVAGVIVAFSVGALLHFFPPFELTSGLALGFAVAIFAPVGDLAMSAAKRSLGLKDMGSVLPGHGGFLDRIDGLIFVIPVAWAIFVWAGIL